MNTVLVNTELLKSKRTEKGLTMAIMADAAGYKSPSSYYFIESGTVIPSKTRVEKIAKKLGMQTSELIIHSKHAEAQPESVANVFPVKVDSNMPTNQVSIDAGNGRRITIQISVD